MKPILILTLLMAVLSGCGGGGGGGKSSATTTDPFLAQVQALVKTMPEDTEPTDYSDLVVSTSESSEPISP